MSEGAINCDARVFVAGHRGLVGGAIVRRLRAADFQNLLLASHAELDLTDQAAVNAWFARERPAFVFLAAARVGGIQANSSYPADFIRDNLSIQSHVIDAAHRRVCANCCFSALRAFIRNWRRSRSARTPC